MKKIIFLFLLLITITVNAQKNNEIFDIDIGFSIKENLAINENASMYFLYFNIGDLVKTNFYFGFEGNLQFRTKGVHCQGWHQDSKDINIVESGIEYNNLNLVFGHTITDDFIIAGIAGYLNGTYYHNCYDKSQPLFKDGKWYETDSSRNDKSNINIGIELKYYVPTDINLSIPFTFMLTNNYAGFAIGVGF